MCKLLALILLVPIFACGEDRSSPSLPMNSPPATSQPKTHASKLLNWGFVSVVLTSSLFSSGIVFYLNGIRERKQFRRTKLEELFMANEDFCKMIEVRFLPFIKEIKERPNRISEYKEAVSKYEEARKLHPQGYPFLKGRRKFGRSGSDVRNLCDATYVPCLP